jgi:hypothetical protein
MSDAANTTPLQVRPRIRFGAIAWGLIVCGIAGWVLSTLLTPGARTEFADWVLALTPAGLVIIAVLVTGGLVLLLGLLGLARRAQRAARMPKAPVALS